MVNVAVIGVSGDGVGTAGARTENANDPPAGIGPDIFPVLKPGAPLRTTDVKCASPPPELVRMITVSYTHLVFGGDLDGSAKTRRFRT